MDKVERKRLKNKAKRILAEEAAELERRLKKGNPYSPGDPRWAQVYKAQVLREKELRQNPPNYISAEDIEKNWVLLIVHQNVMLPEVLPKSWYLQCQICFDIIHTKADSDTSCSCKSCSVTLSEFVTELGEVEFWHNYCYVDHPPNVVKLSASSKVAVKSKGQRLVDWLQSWLL